METETAAPSEQEAALGTRIATAFEGNRLYGGGYEVTMRYTLKPGSSTVLYLKKKPTPETSTEPSLAISIEITVIRGKTEKKERLKIPTEEIPVKK